jgi:raffinose/stachyose/melibiose transport system permease protein
MSSNAAAQVPELVRKKGSRFWKKHGLEYFVFVAPALILFTIFFVLPFVFGFYLSFTSWNGIADSPTFIGLENFVKLFTRDSRYHQALGNTFRFTLVTIVGQPLFAYILAILLTRPGQPNSGLRAAFFLPHVISMVILGEVWRFIYIEVLPSLGETLSIGLLDQPWLTSGSMAIYSIGFTAVWRGVGFHMLVFIAGIESIPKGVIESAELDGATGFKKHWYIILPNLLAAATVSLFLTLTGSLKVFPVVMVMTGGGPGRATVTAVLDLYNTTFNSSLFGYGSAKAIVLLFIILAIGLTQLLVMKKREVEYG